MAFSASATTSPADLGQGVRLVGGRARRVGKILCVEDCRTRLVTDLAIGEVEDGDLIVVRGEQRPNGLTECELVRRTPAQGGRDVVRFSEQGIGERLWQRHRAKQAIRNYFDRSGFCEVDTPAMVPSPGLDVHLAAFEVEFGAGQRAYLSTSPEYQMKRLLVGGLTRCYQLAPAFRDDEQGRHHNREFTMLEWYRGFGSPREVMQDTEEVVGAVFECFDRQHNFELSRPFERISVAEAFRQYADIAEDRMLQLASTNQEEFFRVLVDKVEPALAREARPVFLERYPRPMASLARLCADDTRYAERFELYLGGVELCNGFGELIDAAEQERRFRADQAERQELGRPVYPIDERFIEALQAGMPEASGNALGFDRLLMLACGAAALDEVLAFPASEL